MAGKTKKKNWFKMCPEKWIFGSTREEMTPSERGVWTDFLALAAMNDPPGQIDFFTEKRLANSLNISKKLLRATIEKAIQYKKIVINGAPLEQSSNKKKGKNETACAKPGSKKSKLVQSSSKIGIQQRSIIILKWNEYQSEYLRQKPYREKTSGQEEDCEDGNKQDAELQNSGQESVTRVTDRGEERRKDKIRGEERRKNEENDSEESNLKEVEFSSSSSSPASTSTPKEFSEGERNSSSLREEESRKSQFLAMLAACPDYPFNAHADGSYFLWAAETYPDVDLLVETDKKIRWWKDNLTALNDRSKDPHAQLSEWFEKHQEYLDKRNNKEDHTNEAF